MTLEDVLANERGEAAVLRARKHGAEADAIERVCDRVSAALAHYLTWLSESEAALRSSRSRAWLREHFAGMASKGDAKREGRHRLYRASGLPETVNPQDARQRGRRLVA